MAPGSGGPSATGWAILGGGLLALGAAYWWTQRSPGVAPSPPPPSGSCPAGQVEIDVSIVGSGDVYVNGFGFGPGPGGTSASIPACLAPGSQVLLKAVPRPGASFAFWQFADGSTTSENPHQVTAPASATTIRALFS